MITTNKVSVEEDIDKIMIGVASEFSKLLNISVVWVRGHDKTGENYWADWGYFQIGDAALSR